MTEVMCLKAHCLAVSFEIPFPPGMLPSPPMRTVVTRSNTEHTAINIIINKPIRVTVAGALNDNRTKTN